MHHGVILKYDDAGALENECPRGSSQPTDDARRDYSGFANDIGRTAHVWSRDGGAGTGTANGGGAARATSPDGWARPQRALPRGERVVMHPRRGQGARDSADVIVIGGGLAGLAAAGELGERAMVLEADSRPGGLVRSERFGDYWFDRVIHLLYFPDPLVEQRVRALLGDALAPTRAEAWVECAAGVVRYPFQMHLGGLDRETAMRCVADLASVTFAPSALRAPHFEAWLREHFGEAMCRAFLFPYNRKVWRRPLDTLAPTGFTWTITRPDFAEVLRGVRDPERRFESYNARGFYPRPPEGAPVRGMEVLSRALATEVRDLRVGHRVEEIDLDARTVTARVGGERVELSYRDACLATAPLPVIVSMCRQAPLALRTACRSLVRNRVLSVALSIRGPRPVGRGHWRYYADESVAFTRLIYQHEFDPDSAPADGWGLLVEVVERAEDPRGDDAAWIARVSEDVRRVGALPEGCTIVDAHVLLIDPAYVVFTPESEAVVASAREFLRGRDVVPLGRYGRWEYSSMAQVMRDGYRAGEELNARHRAESAALEPALARRIAL